MQESLQEKQSSLFSANTFLRQLLAEWFCGLREFGQAGASPVRTHLGKAVERSHVRRLALERARAQWCGRDER